MNRWILCYCQEKGGSLRQATVPQLQWIRGAHDLMLEVRTQVWNIQGGAHLAKLVYN